MTKLAKGDRVAYSAKWLKNTGHFTGPVPFRRGTYEGKAKGFPVQFGRVRWDDIEDVIASGEGQYGDPEYVADVRQHGSLVNENNIAKIGSARFALNDL